MPAKLWTGTISFGLVAIPVSLVPASRASGVAFHLLHDADYARCVRQMRCTADGEIVGPEKLIHGVEVEPGHFVVVSEQELEGLAVERSTTIEIDKFVDEEAIAAMFVERPYYLLPDGVVKPYRLLVNALKERRRMGIATFVMHSRERLVAIRAFDELLCLLLLRFGEELRSPEELRPPEAVLTPEEISTAGQLVEELTRPFDPLMFVDEYQQRVRDYLRERQVEQGTISAPHVEREGEEEYTDLMAALEESMARARERRGRGMPREEVRVRVDGHSLKLSNLDKVLYPVTGTTKGEVIAYYTKIASVLLPHLRERPVTLKRYPDGVDGLSFFEKECPGYRPIWTATIDVPSERKGVIRFCMINDPATLIWVANLAALELHPQLALGESIAVPTVLVFDLDPGAPATCSSAVKSRSSSALLNDFGLRSYTKTSGGKGLHFYVPLNTPVTYTQTKGFAHSIAQLFERHYPDQATSNMAEREAPR